MAAMRPRHTISAGINQPDLLTQITDAGILLGGQRVTVMRRAALENVGNVHRLARNAHRVQVSVQQFSRRTHKRNAGLVLLAAGASPTNIRRARESPTPNTDLVRVSHRGHARQSAQRPRRLSSAVPADVSAGVYVSVTGITPFGRTDRRHLRRARPAVAPRRMQGMPASSPQAGYAAWLPPCSGWSGGYISAWC